MKLKYIYGIYNLLDFYCMLKEYQPDTKSIQNVNYFFYDWWRSFLYEVAILYDEENRRRLNPDLKIKIKKIKNFEESISFTTKLNELDKICGFDLLDEKIEIYQNSRLDI